MGKHGAVTKVTHKKTGYAQLRTSPGVMADLERRAGLIAAAATRGAGEDTSHGSQEGFAVDTGTGKGPNRRGRASVRTATRAAIQSEATDRTLTKAFRAGRG
jgi:hypothetical protein